MTFPPRPTPRPAPGPGRDDPRASPNWIPDRPAAPPREGMVLADALRLANPRMPIANPSPGMVAASTTGAALATAEPPTPRLGELSQVYNRARVLAGRRQALSEWLGPVLGPRVRLSNVRAGTAVLFVDSASLAVALRRKHADIIAFLVGRGTSVTRLDVRIAPTPGQGATQHSSSTKPAKPPRPFG